MNQDAKLLPVKICTPFYHQGSDCIPVVNISASIDSNNKIHIALVNLDPKNKIAITVSMGNLSWKSVHGQILTGEKFTDINTFQKPDKIIIQHFSGSKKQGNDLKVDMPPKSLAMFELN